MSLWKAAHDRLLDYVDTLERGRSRQAIDAAWNRYEEARNIAQEATA